MKIAQVRASYYFEFLRIIVMLPMDTSLAKYDIPNASICIVSLYVT